MPTVSPFNTPATPQSQTQADGIYYGWMGLIAQPTFIAAMASIVSTGMKAALTDAAVIAAFKSEIVGALTDATVIAADKAAQVGALTDPTVAVAQKAILFDSILASLNDCDLTVTLSPRNYTTQEKRAWMLLCLAAAAVRNGNFTGDESNQDLLDLLARMDNDTNLLIP